MADGTATIAHELGQQPGMDTKLEKKFWSPAKLTVVGLVLAGICLSVFLVMDSNSGTRQVVSASTVSISSIRQGEFHEYVPVVGRVRPVNSVLVGVIQGGQVEEIFVEDGQTVAKGDPILRLANDTFVQRSIENESRYITAIQQLRESRIRLTREELEQEDELLDANYELLQLQRQLTRIQGTLEKSAGAVTQADYDDLNDEIQYRQQKNEVLVRQLEQDRVLRQQQLVQIDDSLERSQRNLDLIQQSFDNLTVTASISGQLSTLSAEVGQSINQGENIGQIDDLTSFKVSSQIDQFYITKVSRGQRAELTFNGQRYSLTVYRIAPEVTNEVFTVDFSFDDAVPSGLRPGQSLQIKLELGTPEDGLLLSKGGHYRETGGQWIYKLSEDGSSAYRQPIRLGRQNPQFFEVLEGLKAGDRVITSSYSAYENADELNFDKPL